MMYPYGHPAYAGHYENGIHPYGAYGGYAGYGGFAGYGYNRGYGNGMYGAYPFRGNYYNNFNYAPW